MSEIILCNRPLSNHQIKHQCGIDIDQVSGFACSKPKVLTANTLYSIGPTLSPTDAALLAPLSLDPVSRELTNLTMAYGPEHVHALAEFNAKLSPKNKKIQSDSALWSEFGLNMLGTSTSIHSNRMKAFTSSVKAYENALMEYRAAVQSKSTTKAILKARVRSAFDSMQRGFKNELRVASDGVTSRRGAPLNNVTRATNIASSSRSAVKLQVANQVEASNLVKLTKNVKYLGNGLAVIDLGQRIGNVSVSYKAGQNWEREMFIESTSLGASAIAGETVGSIGVAALGFIAVATPIGWVGLIICAGVATAATVGAAMTTDKIVKKNSGDVYDWLMARLGI